MPTIEPPMMSTGVCSNRIPKVLGMLGVAMMAEAASKDERVCIDSYIVWDLSLLKKGGGVVVCRGGSEGLTSRSDLK